MGVVDSVSGAGLLVTENRGREHKMEESMEVLVGCWKWCPCSSVPSCFKECSPCCLKNTQSEEDKEMNDYSSNGGCCQSSSSYSAARGESTSLLSSAASHSDPYSSKIDSNYVSADGPSTASGGNKTAKGTSRKRPVGGGGLESVDSGLSSSPTRTVGSLSRSHSVTAGGSAAAASGIVSQRGQDLLSAIQDARKWKERFNSPTSEFLAEMDKLFMDCQVHLSDLSSHSTASNRKEVDALVDELVGLRNHWGTKLLPLSVCNAFIRERIFLNLGLERYRIDCTEFFEPVPYYSQSAGPNTGDLVKLLRFSVYDLSRDEVLMRYFLERSSVNQVYHVLCFSKGNERGQVHPYGLECPSYWTVRDHMTNDFCTRMA